MKRSVIIVLLVVSIVFAGCNGLLSSGSETPSQTVTSADVPTDEPTSTPVPQLAPGLTGRGVTDAFALGEAHAAVLENTSYTVFRNTTTQYANGTVGGQVNGTFRVTQGQRQAYHTVTAIGPVQSAFIINDTNGSAQLKEFKNGDRIVQAVTHDNRTSYTVAPSTVGWTATIPASSPTGGQRIASVLSSSKTIVTAQEHRNGTTLYRVEPTNVTSHAPFETRWDNPHKIRFQALVDSRGLVHEYRLTYTATADNNTVQIHRGVRYTNIGNTTVERPSWYEGAIENASTATPAG